MGDYYSNSGHLLWADEETLEALGITKKFLHDKFHGTCDMISEEDWEEEDALEILCILAREGTEFELDIHGHIAHINLIIFDETASDHDEVKEGLYLEFYPGDLAVTAPTPLVDVLAAKNIEVNKLAWVSWG